MSLVKLMKRLRRRPARASDDPCAVFRTFVHVLAQMRAQTRHAAQPEKS